MRRASMIAVFVAAVLLAGCSKSGTAPQAVGTPEPQPAGSKIVRTAVIGGMTMTGLWDEISRMFEAETGYKVKVVATGPRPIISEAFKNGEADLLTMHSGDITTDLVADGYGINMRPWTRNDLVIIGPDSDPAAIRGMKNGAAAFKRIAETKSSFIDSNGIGSREVCHKMWKKAGIAREGSWVIKDETTDHLQILEFAREHNAYLVLGRMPVLYGKLKAEHMGILVEGDPDMQRPYIVMEANPVKIPKANVKGAHALAEFLLSDKVQGFLPHFEAKNAPGALFHPLKLVASAN